MPTIEERCNALRETGLRKRGRPRGSYKKRPMPLTPPPQPPAKCYEWWIKYEAFGHDESRKACAVASSCRPYEPMLIVGQAIRFDRAVRGTWPDWLPAQEPVFYASVFRKEVQAMEQMRSERGIPMSATPKPAQSLDWQI